MDEVTKAGARVVVVSFGSPQVCRTSTDLGSIRPHLKQPSYHDQCTPGERRERSSVLARFPFSPTRHSVFTQRKQNMRLL